MPGLLTIAELARNARERDLTATEINEIYGGSGGHISPLTCQNQEAKTETCSIAHGCVTDTCDSF
jgi:hypothetical protein